MPGATLCHVKGSVRGSALIAGAALLSLVVAVAPAAAQGRPVGRLPNPLDQARDTATQPFSTLPMPDRPAERYVPPRPVPSSTPGGPVLVPGHYERDVNGQRVEVPPLVVTTPQGGNPTVVPGGERPPVEQRPASP
ncbi:MAG TPA: hypothetical protein VEH80_10725 [Candidatus Bathyarchaeia archaeon]|nr:hypothetical protein [Candidatus Bathyarchaeia archaeon]